MDHQTLVTEDIEAGRKFLALIDASGARVSAAFWLNDSEQNEWKLVIAKESETKSSFDDYLALRRLLDQHPQIHKRISLSNIQVVRPDDVLVANLSSAVPGANPKSVQRWQGAINGMLIDDAVIYRTAA